MSSKEFIQKIATRHAELKRYPTMSQVREWWNAFLPILFPERAEVSRLSADEIEQALLTQKKQLEAMLSLLSPPLKEDKAILAQRFLDRVPEIFDILLTDIQAILEGDPAATDNYEVVKSYPGFYAIACYRIAHVWDDLSIPLLPRLLTEYAHSMTGIDIHPSALIGKYFFIDHGTGIVIGGTSVIGERVKLYQGVTLGALSVSKNMASTKRHPTIEDNVVIYSGATILGGDTVVGRNSIIGGNVWLTHSIAPNTKIYHQEEVKIKTE